MTRPLASYDRPPVVEVVLGVQFEPLRNFTSGHLGWFWKSKLGPEWRKVADAKLPDRIEPFGASARVWVPDTIRIQIEPSSAPDRLQISNSDRDGTIQIQQTQFLYNWLRQKGEYPRFNTIRDNFEQPYRQFQEFAAEADLGRLLKSNGKSRT